LEETGVVSRHSPVDSAKVLAAEPYWNPEKDSRSNWLYSEVFPSVRSFLTNHGGHPIVFGEFEAFYDDSDEALFAWIQEGFLAEAMPRWFLEKIRCKSWDEVCAHIAQMKFKPHWWDDTQSREKTERWYKAQLIRASAVQ
jgi:hypothetical protein